MFQVCPTDIIILLNEIHKIDEENLMDKILSYCSKYDYNPQEIGDLLAESETFKRTLWLDCVDNNTIRDALVKDKLNSTATLDEW